MAVAVLLLLGEVLRAGSCLNPDGQWADGRGHLNVALTVYPRTVMHLATHCHALPRTALALISDDIIFPFRVLLEMMMVRWHHVS